MPYLALCAPRQNQTRAHARAHVTSRSTCALALFFFVLLLSLVQGSINRVEVRPQPQRHTGRPRGGTSGLSGHRHTARQGLAQQRGYDGRDEAAGGGGGAGYGDTRTSRLAARRGGSDEDERTGERTRARGVVRGTGAKRGASLRGFAYCTDQAQLSFFRAEPEAPKKQRPTHAHVPAGTGSLTML